jgi:hypothetical protein
MSYTVQYKHEYLSLSIFYEIAFPYSILAQIMMPVPASAMAAMMAYGERGW